MNNSEKRIVPVIIAAIIDDKERFLMTKRIHLDPEDYSAYHNAWQLPGGGIEFGETPAKTLIREIKEELMVEIEIIQLIPKIYSRIRKNWQGIFIVYLCKLKNQQAKIILNEEASEYKWYTINEAKKLKTLPGTREIIKDAIKI